MGEGHQHLDHPSWTGRDPRIGAGSVWPAYGALANLPAVRNHAEAFEVEQQPHRVYIEVHPVPVAL